METRGGRVHHAYGRCAPYIRNSRTIHAVPMHHHPRFCCSLGAAYAKHMCQKWRCRPIMKIGLIPLIFFIGAI